MRDAVHDCDAQKSEAERPSPLGEPGRHPEYAEGHGKGHHAAQVAERTREPSALHPADLVKQRGPRGPVQRHVVDDVTGEHHFFPGGMRKLAQDEIIRTVRAQRLDATEACQDILASGHGWSKRELHAFEQFGHQHAG